MNHKVFRSIFVVAVALGIVSVMARMKDGPVSHRPATPETESDPLARPFASYRVVETPTEGKMEFRGANYNAEVSKNGFLIGQVPEVGSRTAAREFTVEFGTPRVEQGTLKLECESGRLTRVAHGVQQINRGAVIEEYVLENRRAEQIFRFPAALAEGALKLCLPVKSDLGGQVVVYSPEEEGFKPPQFVNGGLAFCDRSGETRLAYHSAVAIDAEGRRLALAPRYERAEVVLEVPADFMAKAAYPVVIDPWLDMGVGISSGFHSAERPAFAKFGSGANWAGVVCWSDSSNGNFEIYVTAFNENEFLPYGTSGGPGGISQNLGRSVNPAIVLNGKGEPFVAWEDDTSGTISIYFKKWTSSSSTWDQLAGSAIQTGVSRNLGGNRHPSISFMIGRVPGVVTVDPLTGATTSTPPTQVDCPVISWDTGGAVWCSAFYPGAPAIPANPPTQPIARSAVPAGWYQLGTLDGAGVDPANFTSVTVDLTGGAYPSLVVDGNNRPAIAFQGTASGNYEIYMRRWNYNAAVGFQFWQVVANAANTGFDISPPANFGDVTGSAVSTGLVSGTLNPSQYPSMAVGSAVGAVDLAIAWQETESAVAPVPPGLTSQIYVAYSTGAVAFGALGTSLALGGISKTTALATNPSIDMLNGSVGVAWADTSNSRSSIYVRTFDLGGPATWNQVGFQGSAFPPAFVGELAPIGGVSQSPNYAIQPQIAFTSRGTMEVVWADGASSSFNILGKQFVPNAPGIAAGIGTNNPTFATGVSQSSTDPAIAFTPISVAGFSSGTSVWLMARVFTETVVPATTTLRLEYEIQPAGVSFTGTPNFQSLFVAPDSPVATPANFAILKFDGLPNFNYHWRARTIDQIGRGSPWVSPGEISGVSFRINASASTGGTGPVNIGGVTSGGRNKSQCGLTGLEAVALLAALRLLRRRRA